MNEPDLHVSRVIRRRGRVHVGNTAPLRIVREELEEFDRLDQEELEREIEEKQEQKQKPSIPKRHLLGDDGLTTLERRVRKIPRLEGCYREGWKLLISELTSEEVGKLLYYTTKQGYAWSFNTKLPDDYEKSIIEEMERKRLELFPGAVISDREMSVDSKFYFTIGTMSIEELLSAGFDSADAEHPELFYDREVKFSDDTEVTETLRFERPVCIKIERKKRDYEVTITNPAGIIAGNIDWSSDWNGKSKERKYPINLENADWAYQLQKDLLRFVKTLKKQ